MPTATITVDEALKARLTDPCFAAWLMLTAVSTGVFPYSRCGLAPQCSGSKMLIAWQTVTRLSGLGGWPSRCERTRLLMLTISNRGYVWWPDMVSPALLPEVRSAGSAKHLTDRYLLGMARRNGGRVITFDRALAPAGGDDIVCLSPA